ncbi:MAG: hypothetical protein J0647_04490, partial [Campylobacteraceae bacterium]|nr:hypothetical protein [Campylobacteraceae bacterium]
MSKTILIRCDGYKEIGLGHVVRCLVLAKQLRDLGHKVIFATQNKNPGFQKIQEENFEITPIDKLDFSYQPWIEHLLSKIKIDTFIGDVRDGLPREVIQYMKQNHILTIAIDEPSDYAKECDLCFYPPHAEIDTLAYQGKVYQGFEYVILREEFYKPFIKIKNEIPNVLVMMGGTDAYNLSYKIVEKLYNFGKNIKLLVILEKNHSDYQKIENLGKNIKIYSDIKNMGKFLSRIDFAVINFGVSAYEMLAMNIPAIHIHHNQNDALLSDYFI